MVLIRTARATVRSALVLGCRSRYKHSNLPLKMSRSDEGVVAAQEEPKAEAQLVPRVTGGGHVALEK